ncbi:MAG: hypothetical protein R2784_16395 [Saprospiraceae bacterium]
MKTKSILLFAFLTILFWKPAFASEDSLSINWLKIEGGPYFSQSAGFYFSVGYSYKSQGILSRANFKHLSELSINTNPKESLNTFGLSFGIFDKSSKFFRAELLAGPSICFGKVKGEFLRSDKGFLGVKYYEKENLFSPGLDLDLAIYAIAFHKLAMGINFWSHLNFEKQIAGIGLHFNLGNFKT